jgi:hypothetical protein
VNQHATRSAGATASLTHTRPTQNAIGDFVLRGMLTAYTAADGITDGSVSILVKSSNSQGASLKGKTLKFDVSSSTRVVVRGGGSRAETDNGIVKVRGPKKLGPNLATVLQALTARQVIDQGLAG